ncbi:MAG: HAMP domain-containing protein [Nitrospiraceae bacterium]|nr:MAG: HAMP domain-containing protein [Nitrospiraceae bacterium]
MKIKVSIRRRLVLSLVLLAIVPLLLLGTLLSWQSYVIQQRQIIELQNEKAGRALVQINSTIYGLEKALYNALNIYLNILDSDISKQRRVLSELLSLRDEKGTSVFNELTLIDALGQELARESRTSIITPDELVSRATSEEFTAPLSSRKTYFGPVFIDGKTGVPVMLLSVPVIDVRSDTVRGVLVAEMKMKFMWDIVDKINVGESGLVYIVDTTGRVIVHPNPSVVLKETYYDVNIRSGTGTGLDGGKAVLTHDTLQLGNRHLHVMTEVPLEIALRNTYTSLLTIFVFLVLALTGSIYLGFIIVRKVIRPVESLAETAKAISSGDISRRSDISGNDELGALSDSFNLMTGRLAETITSLKSEIAAKEAAEKKIRLAYEEWQRTFDSISQPVSIHDREYRIIRANRAFADFFKLSYRELLGKKCFELFHCSNGPIAGCPHRKTLDTGLNSSEELFEPTLDKHLRHTTSPILDDNGDITGSVHIAEDITERKHTEEKIIASLKEKEVLLKEVHHRVKNNMQVISSLLNLQARQISDKQYADLFNESRNRIASMSLVHEKLYNSRDLAHVDFKDYVHTLVNGLSASYGAASSRVFLTMLIENITLSIDTAIPCGLIINELVSNSLKYAFPEDKKGELKIVLEKADSDEDRHYYNLIISDNGIGIPEDIDIRKTKSLGLQLVSNLVEHQLQGNITLDRSGGTLFHITFRELKYKNRI